MKKMLVKLLGISGVVIVGFFVLSYIFQVGSEKALAKELSNLDEADQTEGEIALESELEKWDEIDQLPLNDYAKEMGYSDAVMEQFQKHSELDTSKVTYDELTREQFGYLQNLKYLIDQGERPILIKNEQAGDSSDGPYSLQAQLMDIAAMPSDREDKATSIITDICNQHQVDPDGKIKDLDTEIIREIDNAINLASGHDVDSYIPY